MNDTDEKPMDPACPNAPTACPIIIRYQGGGRQMSWCAHCNAYSNRRFEDGQVRKRARAMLPPPVTRLDVIERAAAAHAEYPQYDGKWRDPKYRLVRMRRGLTTKSGEGFKPGDITLAYVVQGGEFDGSVFAYSWRTEVETLLRSAEDAEFIDG